MFKPQNPKRNRPRIY